MTTTATDTTMAAQIERLVSLGVHTLAGLAEDEFRELGAPLLRLSSGTLAVHPSLVPPSRLTPLLSKAGKPGFVVIDMTDLDSFEPREGLDIPSEPLYAIDDVDRGDDMRGWTPEEALVQIAERGRRPLTISEGISWLLQQPDQLEANRCFMTIASRKRGAKGLDARTPAIWISNGTGRDGAVSKGAPKVGWCWAGNRHTWLGFASTAK